MAKRFGVRVERIKATKHHEGGWAVSLPHQCDTWDIAGEGSDGGHGGGWPATHTEAVAALAQFCAEAHTALDALRRGMTYKDGEFGP